MKKFFLSLATACMFSFYSFAQPTTAPDFTLTDINGNAHSLYQYLDQSYTVFVDFSAVWCPPCWSYHTSGALEDLYVHHGPAGYPNVDPNTTDDVMVFFIEADENPLACLQGTGCGTQGDWVTGTPFPLFLTDGTPNSSTVNTAYGITAFPTIFMICPDRSLTDVGQPTNPYSSVNCNPAATLTNDPKVLSYSAASIQCNGTLAPVVTIMNNGINNLTSLDIEVDVTGATTFNTTVPWTGNLGTYQSTNFVLPTITGMQGYEFVLITASNPNGGVDGDLNNNMTGFTSYPPGVIGVGQITASISQSGSSLTANAANGDAPYSYVWSNGQTGQTITPSTGGSYSVTITDANGCVSDPVTHIFTLSTGIEQPSYVDALNIYPNPSQDVFTITFNSERTQDLKVSILNLIGETVYIEELRRFSGEYTKRIDFNDYSSSIYFLQIETDNGVVNKKLLVQ